MTDAERWRNVDRVFEAALDRPPGERTAFVDAACAGDPGLRREVERLLAADARQAGFLDHPADEVFGWSAEERAQQQLIARMLAAAESGHREAKPTRPGGSP